MTHHFDPVHFIRQTKFSDLPETVIKMAERCCLDLIGVAAAGRLTKASEIAHQVALNLYGAGCDKSPLMFSDKMTSPAGAAFANAITIDAFDAHDGHRLAKGHAGVAILPAVLTFIAAETSKGKDSDGQEFLTLLATGYEISLRAGISLHATVSDYHSSGAWNAIGSAAVGARVLGLDKDQTRHALGIAEYYGPRSQMMRCIDHPTMIKDGSGWGAMAGVSAAYLAAEGFTGAPAVSLEGDDSAAHWKGLGKNWEMLAQYFKPVPVCRWAQPAMQAVQDVLEKRSLTAEEIDTLTITTFHEALRLAGHAPKTTEEAQYAIAFPVAALICNGKTGAAEISDATLNNAKIAALSRKIILREADKYNAHFPQERWADVSIKLKSGEIIQTPPTCPIGDPATPLSDQQISEKFHMNCQEIMDKTKSQAIEASVMALRYDKDGLAVLLSLLNAPPDNK